MPDLIDFDAFRAEQKKEPLRLKVGGTVFDLPPSLPASLAFELLAVQKRIGADGEMDSDTISRLGADLFGGEEQFMAILNAGRITMAELPDLLELVLTTYQGGPNQGNRATRRRAGTTSRSSKTGPS